MGISAAVLDICGSSRQWSEPPAHGIVVESPAVRQWWKTFRDSTLEELVERAVEANLDLRTAAARVTEARAARGVSASALLPSIGTTDGYTRVRGGIAQGLNRTGVVSGSPASRSSLLAPFETSIFQTGFDASWELDFFGGARRAVEAATADVRAAEEGRRDAQVTVLAEIGRNYLEARGIQKRLGVTRSNIETQRQTLDLTRVRYEAGLATDLDVARAAAQLATTQAAIPSLESGLARAIHRLGVLLDLEVVEVVRVLQRAERVGHEVHRAEPAPAQVAFGGSVGRSERGPLTGRARRVSGARRAALRPIRS